MMKRDKMSQGWHWMTHFSRFTIRPAAQSAASELQLCVSVFSVAN